MRTAFPFLIALSLLGLVLTPACGGPSTEKTCDDGVDDDEDGFTDCEDQDCNGNAACACGDGTCDGGEDEDTCPADCAVCDQIADLLVDRGCAAGETCTVNGGNIECVTPGPNAAYDNCQPDSGCAAGTTCVNPPTGGAPICTPFCDRDGAGTCPGTGLCILTLATPDGTAGLCIEPDDCDLLTGAGCTAPAACYVASSDGLTICFEAGSVAVGDPCTSQNDCLRGHLCNGNPSLCEELCDLDTPACSAGACADVTLSVAGVGLCQ